MSHSKTRALVIIKFSYAPKFQNSFQSPQDDGIFRILPTGDVHIELWGGEVSCYMTLVYTQLGSFRAHLIKTIVDDINVQSHCWTVNYRNDFRYCNSELHRVCKEAAQVICANLDEKSVEKMAKRLVLAFDP